MTDPVTIGAEEGTPYLAVDVQPDVVQGVFSLGHSLINGPDRLARTPTWTGLWENVVCDVQSVSLRRGVSRLAGLLSAAEAGTCTVVVSDSTRAFDPTANADTIHKGTPLRVRAWGYRPVVTVVDGEEVHDEQRWNATLWTGEVDQLAVIYHPDDPPTVTITGVDLIAVLAAWEAEGRPDPGVGEGDDLLERVQRVLVEAGRAGTYTARGYTYTIPTDPTPETFSATGSDVLTERRAAAAAIRNRLLSGALIYEDWTWPGAPASVGRHNDTLQRGYRIAPSIVACAYVLDRYQSGLPIFEDFTWHGCPRVVSVNNDWIAANSYPIGWNNVPQITAWLTGQIINAAARYLAEFLAATTPPPPPPQTPKRSVITKTVATTTVSVTVYSDMSAINDASDQTFTATLAPVPLARPWDEISAGVEAELGRLWVDRDNRLLIRARGSELTGTVHGTLSDVHGETDIGVHCCLADATVVYGWETAGNRVIAGRRLQSTEDPGTGVQVRRDYVSSQARYGTGVLRGDSLDLETDEQLGAWAEAVIVAHARPRLRVDRVIPRPSPHDLDSALAAWPAVLQTDIGDRWLFRYHPHTGPTVRRAVGVLGIELDATPQGWTVSWTTTEAPTPGRSSSTGWFVIGESVVNSGDAIAPYRVKV